MLRNRKKETTSKLAKKGFASPRPKKQFKDTQTMGRAGLFKTGFSSKSNQFKEGDNKFNKHFASTTQLIYNSFDDHCYLPPHLSSIQVKQSVFKGEPKQSKIRPSSARKYDYDSLYFINESRYLSPRVPKQWAAVQSKIKYLLDEDKLTYTHFHSPKPQNIPKQRQYHPDDDLSQQSSVQPQKE